ncbi:MAG TPA: hypothetical protein VF288_09205 [Mycobacteriales bacterium]
MKHADEKIAAQAAETISLPEVGTADRPDRQGMQLLAAHVPLSLLLDLAQGPESERLLATEAPTLDDLAWLTPAVAS